jgi:hypothetical protein
MQDKELYQHILGLTSTWICRIRRPIPHISIQIRIPSGEADGVLADPSSGGGVVPAVEVVLQPRRFVK